MFKVLRLFIPLLVLVFVLPMWLPGPDGKPVMSWRDWLPSEVPPLLPAGPVLDQVLEQKPATFYRWQDSAGRWHFSDSPPDQTATLAAEPLPAMNNVMDAVVPDPADKPLAGPAPAAGLPFSLTTIPLGDIPQLIDEAKKLQQQAEERRRQLQDF